MVYRMAGRTKRRRAAVLINSLCEFLVTTIKMFRFGKLRDLAGFLDAALGMAGKTYKYKI